MDAWLVTAGENLPVDGKRVRLMRTGLLAQALTRKGHNVTWWTSTFRHNRKLHRFESDTLLQISPQLRLHLLRAPGYRKNVSLRRILNHKILAQKFYKYAKTEPLPDIIVCSLPTLEFSAASVRLGFENDFPVVLDLRDMWPDIILKVAPEMLEPLARLFLWPMYRSIKKSCSRASAITGITRVFVEKGLEYARRPPNKFDRAFPHGYPDTKPEENEIREAKSFWKSIGVESERRKFVVCFFGTFSNRLELPSLVRAARIVATMKKDILFVICGIGESLEQCQELGEHSHNIIFPGWVDFPKIWTLMRMASVGVVPYPSTEDFMASIPNKAIEYVSAGLPVLSSARGALQIFIEKHECGITYRNKDFEQLASIIGELYETPDRISKMSQNAIQVYRKNFVAQKIYGEMSEHMEELVEEHIRRRTYGNTNKRQRNQNGR